MAQCTFLLLKTPNEISTRHWDQLASCQSTSVLNGVSPSSRSLEGISVYVPSATILILSLVSLPNQIYAKLCKEWFECSQIKLLKNTRYSNFETLIYSYLCGRFLLPIRVQLQRRLYTWQVHAVFRSRGRLTIYKIKRPTSTIHPTFFFFFAGPTSHLDPPSLTRTHPLPLRFNKYIYDIKDDKRKRGKWNATFWRRSIVFFRCPQNIFRACHPPFITRF